MCTECLKPRVIYSQRKLTSVESQVLLRTLDGLLFSGGSSLQGIYVDSGEDISIFDRVFVRSNLSCDDPVEIPYYLSEKFALVCTHCGCTTLEAAQGQYPLYGHCRSDGKRPVWKRKRKLVV